MSIPVTALTVGLLSLFFFILSLRVVKLRREKRVSLGDGGNEELRRATRGHANFAEYVPICIVMLLTAELQSVSIILLAPSAAALLVGRLMHGYALGFTAGNVRLRTLGVQLTVFAIVVLAVTNITMPILGWVAS